MIIQWNHLFRWTETKKQNRQAKNSRRPEKPLPQKTWKILEPRNPKMRCQELQALRLLQRSMPKADRPGPLPKVDEWRRCGLQVAAVFKGLSGGIFSILVKMSQIPILESLLLKKNNTKHTTSPGQKSHPQWFVFAWLQILCCSPPYLWATFAGAEKLKQKRSLFLIFFGALPKRSHSFFSAENGFVLQTVLVMISFPEVSFHQAVEVGGLEVVPISDGKKKTKPFPRGKNDLCPFSSLAPWKKDWEIWILVACRCHDLLDVCG